MNKIVLVTGGFDPLHSGHISYFEEAKNLGDKLYVGLNSDAWLTRKKGKPFMPLYERSKIVQNLKMVDYVLHHIDDDDTSIDAIIQVRNMHPEDKIIFANGGDRNKENILEMCVNDSNIEWVFGVGGTNKQNSSSWILNNWIMHK
jgi:D-beta-D-heptose 7-phosphate kinase/D-beta-D-heptose 1-phosphate adenosyltransferase